MERHVLLKQPPGAPGSAAPAPAGPADAPHAAHERDHATHAAAGAAGTRVARDPQTQGATPSSTPGAAPGHPTATSSAAASGSSAKLAPATTARGPLVTSSPHVGAAAQAVLQVVDNLEFRIYGQGFMAGSEAVPLTPPTHKVMYAPTPGEDKPAPPPPHLQQQQQQQQHGGVGGVTVAPAVASAAHPPGTRAPQQLHPLPARVPPLRGDSATATAAPAVSPPSPPVTAAAGGSAAASRPGELRYRGPVHAAVPASGSASAAAAAQQPYVSQQAAKQLDSFADGAGGDARTAQRRPQAAAASHSGTAAGGSSLLGGIAGSVQGWWHAARARAAAGWQWLLRELAHAACVLAQWLLWLVVTPVKALVGPWYRYNRRLKEASLAHLSQPFDLAELQRLLGALPAWLSGIGGATEDLDWLNVLLAEVWPKLDPIVCELIRSSIEPLLDDMKPPFIARMGFQKLTLGELPVMLEGIRLVGANDTLAHVKGDAEIEEAAAHATAAQRAATADDRLEVEVDFRWVGEPNISFFVELAVAGPYTRLVPKVSNIGAQGTLRLGLSRFAPRLPGFGALLVSFARNPQIKFTLDFGPAMGGKVTAKPVAAFLDPFLRDTLASLLVWPNRFVFPLLPRSVTGNLDTLALHSVGVLEIEVLAAHHLPKKGGMLSTVDPQVELWTQPQHRVHTGVKRNRRNPNWKGQALEVLVQEPESQVLRVVVQDIDMLNVTELLRLNVVKGASNLLRAANPIGHASVGLAEICTQPFKRHELELRLAGSEWAFELGVTGEDEAGMLELAATYKPFRDLDAGSSAPIDCRGALFVDVRQCQELASSNYGSSQSDPYVYLKVAGQKAQTVVMPNSLSPVFNSHFEFYNVRLPDTLEVEVYDRDYLKPDDLLGRVELPVKHIITYTQGGVRGVRDGWWRLRPKGATDWDSPGAGRIELRVQYRPYHT